MALQEDWRWCGVCEGLVYTGFGDGMCVGGQPHQVGTSGRYGVGFDEPPQGAQGGWLWCSRCQGLFFTAPDGHCFDGGAHDPNGSRPYWVHLDHVPEGAQDSWCWCNRCSRLIYNGFGDGICWDGAAHDLSQSGAYSVDMFPAPRPQQPSDDDSPAAEPSRGIGTVRGIGFDILRPDDLLTARIDLDNLHISGDGLTRVDPAQPAGLRVTLPPQHYREAVPSSAGDAIEAIAAAPSILEFRVPDGVQEIPIGPDGLWAACQALGVAPTYPLYVPARVYLQPKDGEWVLGVRPATLDGRTELWRARLTGPVRDGRVVARFEIAMVANHELPTWPMLPAPERLFHDYFHGIMEATRFDLSPIGASVRMAGPVGYGPQLAIPAEVAGFIGTYQHDIDFGRDSRVRVVTHGHLSSGHRATLVQLNRRTFAAGVNDIGAGPQSMSFARLEALAVIVVDEPVISVDGLVAAYGGPALDMPFRTLRLLTQQTPPLDADAVGGGSPTWVRTQAGDVAFALQGVDWEGHVVDFSLPLVFIPGGAAFDFAAFQQLFSELGPGEQPAGVVPTPLALADTRGDPTRSATVTVETLQLSVQAAIPAGDTTAGSTPPVLPVLGSMGVVLDAATQFTGRRDVVQATWHTAYREHGLDQAANPLGAYLTLPTPLDLPFDARSIGGLAKPDTSLGAVTALKGAVPQGFELGGRPDVGSILQQFGDAKVLGLVPLTDVLMLDQVLPPTLHQRITPSEVELTYRWNAPIKPNGTILKPAAAPPPGAPPPSLSLTARMTRRLADGATTSHVEGVLTQVDLEIAGVVRLHFDRLAFTADPDRPPQIIAAGMDLTFANELSFLQDLKAALTDAGLAKGASIDVTPSRITAGFAASLPSLPLGMFTISNLSVSTQLTIPFDGNPVAFSFAVADRFKPFGVAVSMFAGGGFFALELDSRGIRRIEASLEFGGSMSLDIVVASGGVYVMAGIYFLYVDDKVTISGYLRAGGFLSVLGIVTISADFYMQLSFQPETGKIHGRASLTIGIKVLFFSKSVTLSVERTFAGSAGDPTFTDCFELEDWQEYCDAFA